MRELIRTCLKFKAEHNLARMGLLDDPVYRAGSPAALAAPTKRGGIG